ncbi:hypothetical protein BDA99DRAFT_601110 [Phascolomyces articulosus]|uniref:Galactose oxidase n=1 Tax=Phascolomyces articulosus TaxID=60185 RepID=A0AAD5PIV9_9FUNG|nr:hypothetical protein BDA99DRAFT_601110 [Phascolomyces articulosus]
MVLIDLSKMLSVGRTRHMPFILSLLTLWSIITIIFTPTVSAAYNMTDEQINLLPGRSTGATFVRNDKMYIYGGVVSRSVVSTQFTSISFNDEDGSLVYADVPQRNPVPMSFSQAVLLPDNNRVLFFGGITNNATLYTGKLLVYEYRFDQQTWQEASALPFNNATFPVNRKELTATLGSDGKVYIAGGFNLVSAFAGAGSYIMGDLWSYNPQNGQFVDLSQPLEPSKYMIGHSAIALPNNKIIFTMGTMGYHERTAHPSDPTEKCNTSFIYDITSNKWYEQELKADEIPWLREGASAILGVRDFAGNAYNPLANLAILDTNTWTWQTTNNVLGPQPTARFQANAGLLKGKYLVIANGRTETVWFNDVYVLNLGDSSAVTPTTSDKTTETKQLAWIENITQPLTESDTLIGSTGLSTGAIVGIVVGIVVALILGVALWKFWNEIFALVWSPRTGEPWWTETSHAFSKLALAGLFVAFLAFLMVQVIHSPISTITLSSPVPKVQVPDVRFCFDGWDKPSIGCQTDTGTIADCSTSGYLRPLNMTKHRPFFIDGQPTVPTCYLFTAPDEFELGDPKQRQKQQSNNNDNGYRIQFIFYGVATKPNPSIDGNTTFISYSRIHVSLYPRGRNPNLAYYFGDTSQKLSESDIQVWLNEERNDLQTSSSNTYTLELGAYSSVAYQLQEHLYLDNDNGWNSIGFAPNYNSVPEVASVFRAGSATQLRVESFGKNILDLYPSNYALVTLKEQKIYTVLTAIGSAGGLLTLLFTLDTFLFGVRPNSPWGVIHRWSMGSAKKSLLTGLRDQFGFLTMAIPFINPVRPHLIPQEKYETYKIIPATATDSSGMGLFSHQQRQQDEKNYTMDNEASLQQENKEIKKQLEELQRRVQLMELMLKSYYINDELFSNLNSAVSNGGVTVNNPRLSNIIMNNTQGWNNNNNNNNGNRESDLIQHLNGTRLPRDERGTVGQDMDSSTLFSDNNNQYPARTEEHYRLVDKAA